MKRCMLAFPTVRKKLTIFASNILRGLTRMLDPTEDFDNIATAEEQMRTVAENRARVLEEQLTALKGLSQIQISMNFSQ